ncbi:hypothetical protein [Fibrella aquatilis]|uniref:hypothetical protein n=1 Tax=Fibrella aquatilis TaxID=2817059 RepID=UPI001E514770|nr:hypothetical protein [Fibrella aquatilis]
MTSPTLSYRSLLLFLTGLLLFVNGGGASVWRSNVAVAQAVAAKKAGKSAESKSDVIIKAASFEAVVAPGHSFDFSHVAYLLPAPIWRFLHLHRPILRRHFEVPYFYFSYLRHVFGHFIAPNAP